MVTCRGLLCYLVLVFLPQTLWLLTSSNQSVCNDCSFLEFQYHHLQQQQDHQITGSKSVPFFNSRSVQDTAEPLSYKCFGPVTANHPYCYHLLALDRGSGISMETVSIDMETMPGDVGMKSYLDCAVSSLCSCSLEERLNVSVSCEEKEEEEDGGWSMPSHLPDLSGPCTIRQQVASSLTQEDFLKDYAYNEPVVIRGLQKQMQLRTVSTKRRLLSTHGHDLITVATANTNSYRKVKMTLCDYVDKIMKPQSLDKLGNETLYHFGDNDREGWSDLFSLYRLPPYDIPKQEPVLSFGLAGPGTGVPFHIHGPTFAETIFGRKRWFLYPPDHTPTFHPNASTLHWLTYTYPTLTEKPLECTLEPGEVLFFPDRWWHATVNVEAAVFMSVFYSIDQY